MLLASRGADLEAQTVKGETALHAAAEQGNTTAITALMQQASLLRHAKHPAQ